MESNQKGGESTTKTSQVPADPLSNEGIEEALRQLQRSIYNKFTIEARVKACINLCTPLKERYLLVSFKNDQETEKGV